MTSRVMQPFGSSWPERARRDIACAVRAGCCSGGVAFATARAPLSSIEAEGGENSNRPEYESREEPGSTGIAWLRHERAAYSARHREHDQSGKQLIVHSSRSCRARRSVVNAGGSA